MNLGDVWLIAAYDLKESVRSRRAWTVGLLFFVASILASWAFIESMKLIEKAMLLVPGGTLDPTKLAQNSKFLDVIKFLIGDARKIDYVVTLPPLGLFITSVMMMSIPWIVALTSTDLVAGDVQHRTVRYVLLRTARINFVLGKVLSQTLLIAGITLTSLLPAVAFAAIQLRTFDGAATVTYLVQSAPAMLSYAFSFVGLAALASQLTGTPQKARSLAMAMFVLLWVVGWRKPSFALENLWSLFSVLSYLSPWHMKGYLYEPELVQRMLGCAMSFGFGVFFVSTGFLHFSRRDV